MRNTLTDKEWDKLTPDFGDREPFFTYEIAEWLRRFPFYDRETEIIIRGNKDYPNEISQISFLYRGVRIKIGDEKNSGFEVWVMDLPYEKNDYACYVSDSILGATREIDKSLAFIEKEKLEKLEKQS